MSNAILPALRELAKHCKLAGQLSRRAWDSNPQVLSDNGFQDRSAAGEWNVLLDGEIVGS
jgi:hypothetical protein